MGLESNGSREPGALVEAGIHVLLNVPGSMSRAQCSEWTSPDFSSILILGQPRGFSSMMLEPSVLAGQPGKPADRVCSRANHHLTLPSQHTSVRRIRRASRISHPSHWRQPARGQWECPSPTELGTCVRWHRDAADSILTNFVRLLPAVTGLLAIEKVGRWANIKTAGLEMPGIKNW